MNGRETVVERKQSFANVSLLIFYSGELKKTKKTTWWLLVPRNKMWSHFGVNKARRCISMTTNDSEYEVIRSHELCNNQYKCSRLMNGLKISLSNAMCFIQLRGIWWPLSMSAGHRYESQNSGRNPQLSHLPSFSSPQPKLVCTWHMHKLACKCKWQNAALSFVYLAWG